LRLAGKRLPFATGRAGASSPSSDIGKSLHRKRETPETRKPPAGERGGFGSGHSS
jgi:hypothetical protein